MKATEILATVILVGGAYVAYRMYRCHKMRMEEVPVKTVPPPGTKLTGRTVRTTDGRKPGSRDEVLGFAVRDWAQVITPTGEFDWVELDRLATMKGLCSTC